MIDLEPTEDDAETPRCSFHNCDLVEYMPKRWDCPISALSDLIDQFRHVYEHTYAPAPAGENGVYQRAERILAAALTADPDHA